MRKAVILLLLLSFFVLYLAAAPPQVQRGPSTAEERQRFVTLAHKMEEAPLDKSLQPEREWALKWLVEVPDISVNVCTAPLGDFMKKKYKYSSEIVVQLTLSSGAFIIEHPDQAKDMSAQYLAGVEGALKAYESILKTKPDAKSSALDSLLDKQRNGTLADYVRETSSKGCDKH